MKRHAVLNDRLAVNLALGLLLALGLAALCWPQGDFSAWERRYLAPAPAAPDLTRWQTDKEVESYLGDRVPLRRGLVGLDAAAQVLTGRRTQLEAWPVGDAIIEQPVEAAPETVARRLNQFARLAESAGARWRVITPPSHGWLMREGMNPLLSAMYEQETPLYNALAESDCYINIIDAFREAENVYYRTDHHWTLAGAALAGEALCASLGRDTLPQEQYLRESYPGFVGTTCSRSGLPFARPDTLDTAEPAGQVSLQVLDSGEVYDHLIFPERTETYDGYAVYLDGNHGLLEIGNPDAPAGTLLVYKDSFANCLLPLLAGSYSRIVAMDARYYAGNFSDALAAAGEVDDILFCYSLDSLLNDTVVARKAGR